MLPRPTTCNRIMETLRRALGAPMPLVQVAALAWREEDGHRQVLLITSRGTGRWVVPKGWPEKGESLWQSAAREAREEAEIEGVIGKVPLGSYYYGKMLGSGLERRCEVRLFPLHVEKLSKQWAEKKQRRRIWTTPEEAARLVHESDLSELIAGFAHTGQKSYA